MNEIISYFYNFFDKSLSMVLLKFITAIVILLVGFIIGKVLGRFIYKVLHNFELNIIMEKLVGVKISLEEIIETFITYFIYFITIVIVLQQIGIATTVLHMIAGGVIIIIILATFLGVKDFIPNAIGGFFIQSKKIIQVGETVKIKGMEGEILEVNLVETKLRTKEGDIIFIPNSAVTKTEIIKIKSKESKKS